MKSLYLLPTLYWNQQSCCFFLPVRTHFIPAYVMWNVRIYSKLASVCFANWIALSMLSVDGVYCMTDLFWKQLLKKVLVKIILISSGRWWRFVTATSAIELISGLWVQFHDWWGWLKWDLNLHPQNCKSSALSSETDYGYPNYKCYTLISIQRVGLFHSLHCKLILKSICIKWMSE